MKGVTTFTSKLKQQNFSLSLPSVVIVTLLLTFPNCYCFKSQHEGLSEVMGIDTCPPWHIQLQKPSDRCFCSFIHNPKQIVYKNDTSTFPCVKNESASTSHSLLLQMGYCMTLDNENNNTLLVKCPYNTMIHHELHKFFVIVRSTVSNLNNFTCGPLRRQDENCKNCIQDYGPSPFTLNLTCFHCKDTPYSGWMLYLTFELVPLTVFFIVITILRINPAQVGYLNSFILLSQVLVATLSFSSQVPFIYSMGKMSIISLILVITLQTLYGFWNLDFFRYVIPGFCVSSSLNNLDVLSLQLISVFYPMSLILVAWTIIHLYERNFRPFVWAWRPFRRCLSHFSVTNNPKRAVVNLFTTFLLLSYSKLLFVAVNITNTIGIYRFNPLNHTHPVAHDKTFLFIDPSIRYFSTQHARYVILSFFLFAVFIVPPPLILFLYPTRWFQTFLNNRCSKSHTIRMFAHACHGCFKNGLNGTRDCRHFAGVYLLLRITLFLCKTAIIPPIPQFIMIAFCFGVATFLIGLYRPYKNPYLNALDFFFMLCFSIASLFLPFVTTSNPTKSDNDVNYKLVSVVFGFIFLCTLLPLVYISCLMIYYCKKKCRKVKHFLSIRRRDYLDISDFQYDPDQETSDNMEQGQAANILRSRVLNSDSFQSE